MERVLLAMSGGVDSSAAAVLLKDAGYDIVGCTMRLWDHRKDPNGTAVRSGRCCSLDDTYDARRVAERLSVPFYVVNMERVFREKVIRTFIGEYLEGRTPSPCVLCNTFVKFDRLMDFARQIGFQRVATGHYVRVDHEAEHGHVLLKARDTDKDQSYFLFELNQDQLARTLFPVGEYPKDAVRDIARANGLITADKPESQEICFVSGGNYTDFIRRQAEGVDQGFLPVLQERQRPGPVLLEDGSRVGTHRGLFRFTVGQRRGLGISHPRPLYVLRLDRRRNAVFVGYKEDLFSAGLVAERVHWISGRPPRRPVRASVKIRSRHAEAPAEIRCGTAAGENGPDVARVVFDTPQMSVSPGQAAVFYQGDRVLGGGWIRERIQ